MRRFSLFIIFLLCFIVQSTVLIHFRLFGVSPDLILALVIVFSFFFEDFDGVFMGVIFGIFEDICFSPGTGVTSLVYLAIGLALQFTRVSVYRDNKIILLITTVLCTVFYYIALWGASKALLSTNTGLTYVLMNLPQAIICNYIAVLAVCHFARKRKGFTV